MTRPRSLIIIIPLLVCVVLRKAGEAFDRECVKYSVR
jgi:hypothetical protein